MKASDYQCDFNHKKALKSCQCMAAFEGLLFLQRFYSVTFDIIGLYIIRGNEHE